MNTHEIGDCSVSIVCDRISADPCETFWSGAGEGFSLMLEAGDCLVPASPSLLLGQESFLMFGVVAVDVSGGKRYFRVLSCPNLEFRLKAWTKQTNKF